MGWLQAEPHADQLTILTLVLSVILRITTDNDEIKFERSAAKVHRLLLDAPPLRISDLEFIDLH